MAPTKIKRSAAPTLNVAEMLADQLEAKFTAARFTSRAEKVKKILKDYLLNKSAGTYVDSSTGSIFYDLDETIEVAGKQFRGMEARYISGQTVFDEDVAAKILKKKGVYEEALSTYVDQDKVARLQQEGKITEADLDKMFETKDATYQFWPVAGEVL